MAAPSALDGKALWGVLNQTFSEWNADKAPMLGAALAYYTVFSLAPLLVIAIAMVGIIFGREAAQGQIFEQVSGLIGEEGGSAIQEMVKNAAVNDSGGILASLVGVAALLLGASGVFGQLQTSLNIMWGVEPKSDRGIGATIKDRFLP